MTVIKRYYKKACIITACLASLACVWFAPLVAGCLAFAAIWAAIISDVSDAN